MKPQKEMARSTAKQSAPEKTDAQILPAVSSAVNAHQTELIALLREILDVLIYIHNLINERLR